MSRAHPRLCRVSIDLTPLQPGGENGGAKLVARSLVRELGALAPGTLFTLLTSAATHAELADLDAPNVQRECVDADLTAAGLATGSLSGPRLAARVLVNTLVPSSATRTRIKDGVWTLVKRQRRARVASAQLADLHFCPFTAPFFFDPRVPLVSLVHDLQFVEHPLFFEDKKRSDRLRHFQDACERSDRLICVSEFVRQTVLANSSMAPSQVQTIHSAVLHANLLKPHAESIAPQVLNGLGLPTQTRYLLYPANVWPHKNHAVLLEAFLRFRMHNEGSDLALVCTGAPGEAADDLKALAERMLPLDSFGFAGFLPEVEFAAVLQHCRALIFPSLYEGFGLPVLEAMACGRPVLCSNTTSLPEVAGDAALLFDPRDAAAVASAIERLEAEPGLEDELIRRGHLRVAAFGSARDMAAHYLAAFDDVLGARAEAANG